MKKTILVDISTLENTMQMLYNKFFPVHKAIVHLYDFQQQYAKTTKTLKDIHATITHVQEWKMRYKGALLYLHKMMKPQTELGKAQI